MTPVVVSNAPFVPVNIHRVVRVTAVAGTVYDLPIAVNLPDAAPMTFTVTYDPGVFAVANLGTASVVLHTPGKIVFRHPEGGGWFTGIVNTVRFEAVGNGPAEISIELSQ